MKDIVLPIYFTRSINQKPEYVFKIQGERLDKILSTLLLGIEEKYSGDNVEPKSYRDRFLESDVIEPEEVIDAELQLMKNGCEELRAAIADFDLLKKDDEIYLKCQDEYLKLPNSIVTKLELLGYYDKDQEALVTGAVRSITRAVTERRSYHDDNVILQDCRVLRVTTLADLVPNGKDTEIISNLQGLGIYIIQRKKEDTMFASKSEKGKEETIIKAPLPYEFGLRVTKNREDAFSTRMDILSAIKKLFLYNPEEHKIDSGRINEELRNKGITIDYLANRRQFIAIKDGQKVLIDRKISQNIFRYVESELATVAKALYSEEPQPVYDVISSEESQKSTFAAYKEYLLRPYKFIEELYRRGYSLIEGETTGIVQSNEIYESNPTSIVLALPYGINGHFKKIDKKFLDIINNGGQQYDPKTLLLMQDFIQIGIESHYEDYVKAIDGKLLYYALRLRAKSTTEDIQRAAEDLFSKILNIILKKPRERYTLSKKHQQPTLFLKRALDIEENPNRDNNDNKNILLITDKSDQPGKTVQGKIEVKE